MNTTGPGVISCFVWGELGLKISAHSEFDRRLPCCHSTRRSRPAQTGAMEMYPRRPQDIEFWPGYGWMLMSPVGPVPVDPGLRCHRTGELFWPFLWPCEEGVDEIEVDAPTQEEMEDFDPTVIDRDRDTGASNSPVQSASIDVIRYLFLNVVPLVFISTNTGTWPTADI